MQHYIIDGNNLIGKIKKIWDLQKKDGQAAREKLAHLIDNYFQGKRVQVTLDFDGFENLPIKTSKLKIFFSQKKTADDLIKHQIEMHENTRTIKVISSDSNIIQFAKVCHCDVQKSEEFAALLQKKQCISEKDDVKRNIPDSEIKKLFGL